MLLRNSWFIWLRTPCYRPSSSTNYLQMKREYIRNLVLGPGTTFIPFLLFGSLVCPNPTLGLRWWNDQLGPVQWKTQNEKSNHLPHITDEGSQRLSVYTLLYTFLGSYICDPYINHEVFTIQGKHKFLKDLGWIYFVKDVILLSNDLRTMILK